MMEYIIEWSGIGARIVELIGSVPTCLITKRIREERLREEIVRCRDCDFSHDDELGNLRCHGPLTEPWDYYNDEPSAGAKITPDGFCAWGVRKESGE